MCQRSMGIIKDLERIILSKNRESLVFRNSRWQAYTLKQVFLKIRNIQGKIKWLESLFHQKHPHTGVFLWICKLLRSVWRSLLYKRQGKKNYLTCHWCFDLFWSVGRLYRGQLWATVCKVSEFRAFLTRIIPYSTWIQQFIL